MDATVNFSLRFTRVSESKVETSDWVLSRQAPQRIATRMSLASEAIGFLALGILIIMNRHQADLNGLAGGSPVAMVGGISAVLWLRFSLSRPAYTGDSAPDILPRYRSGVSRSLSFSPNPTQSQQSLCWLHRHHCSWRKEERRKQRKWSTERSAAQRVRRVLAGFKMTRVCEHILAVRYGLFQ